MSGVVASAFGGEIGLPLLNSSKWSPFTRRETKTALWPPTFSDQVTHGTVAVPGVSEPAATRGSSASLVASLLSEQASSAAVDSAQLPNLLAPVVSSVLTCAGVPAPAPVPLPTARQLNPPSAVGSLTILAAKTCSLLRRPRFESSFSYQTVQATVSLGPVNAMSGSTPLRLGSTFSVGSPFASDPASLARRSRPTCCQQKLLTLAASDGLKPVQGDFGAACLTPLDTKIWLWLPDLLTLPSCSSQPPPPPPRPGVGAGHGRAAGHGGVLGFLVGVDVQRGHAGPAVLALGLPRVGGGGEAAGEDLLRAAQRLVGLVPGVPRHGPPGAREVDRGGLGLDVWIDVQRRPLGDPLAALEGAHEDPLGAAGRRLLERGPRHALAARG